jgi:hypothetical protein
MRSAPFISGVMIAAKRRAVIYRPVQISGATSDRALCACVEVVTGLEQAEIEGDRSLLDRHLNNPNLDHSMLHRRKEIATKTDTEDNEARDRKGGMTSALVEGDSTTRRRTLGGGSGRSNADFESQPPDGGAGNGCSGVRQREGHGNREG